jgi:hypothetical protein
VPALAPHPHHVQHIQDSVHLLHSSTQCRAISGAPDVPDLPHQQPMRVGDLVYVASMSGNTRTHASGFEARISWIHTGGSYVDAVAIHGRATNYTGIDASRVQWLGHPGGPRRADGESRGAAFVAGALRQKVELEKQIETTRRLRLELKTTYAIRDAASKEITEKNHEISALSANETEMRSRDKSTSQALGGVHTELQDVPSAVEDAETKGVAAPALFNTAARCSAIKEGKNARAKQLLVDVLKGPYKAGKSYSEHDDSSRRRVRNKVEQLHSLLAMQASTSSKDLTAVVDYFTSHRLTAALTGAAATDSSTTAETNDAKVIAHVVNAIADTMAGELKNGRGSGEKSIAKQSFLENVGVLPDGLETAFERVFKINRKSVPIYHKRRKRQLTGKQADLSKWTRIFKSRYKNKRSDAPCIADHWHNETTEVPGRYLKQITGKQREYMKHVMHHKYLSEAKMYAKFLLSEEYTKHLKQNPEQTIGCTLYVQGKPFYIKDAPKSQECVCPLHTETASFMQVFKARTKRTHARFNKDHPNDQCDGSCADSDFMKMLSGNTELKQVLLCAQVDCPELKLAPSMAAPAFYKRECVNGDCEKCGWDEKTALRRKMPEMPRCLARYQDFVMGWEEYQTVPCINEFDEINRSPSPLSDQSSSASGVNTEESSNDGREEDTGFT